MTTLRMMAIDAICQRGSIRDSDVATLRRAFAMEKEIGTSHVDALFRAHNLARVRDPAWADFFIETLTDYVVRELEPAGYVTSAHAGWLIARVSSAGRVRSKTEHDLLLNVIDKARWVPESLMCFALAQIRDAVITGEGPLRGASGLGPGAITLAEVEQIRALLFAYGNEGPIAISGAELDLLLDIEEALTAAGDGSDGMTEASPLHAWPLESWQDLVEKATASAALGLSGYTGPSREEALSEARPLFAPALYNAHYNVRPSLQYRTEDAGLANPRSHLLSAYRPLAPEAGAIMRLELQRIEIITGEPVKTADAGHLARRLASPRLADRALARLPAALAAAGIALPPALALPQAAIRAA
jgi:hypothetical protein